MLGWALGLLGVFDEHWRGNRYVYTLRCALVARIDLRVDFVIVENRGR